MDDVEGVQGEGEGVRGWVEGKGKAKASVGVLAFWRFGFFYRTGHWNNAN